jgi:hypothetical protein
LLHIAVLLWLLEIVRRFSHNQGSIAESPIDRRQSSSLQNDPKVLTKSVKGLDNIASLLPKGILVQAMLCEAVHLLRSSKNEPTTVPALIKSSERM